MVHALFKLYAFADPSPPPSTHTRRTGHASQYLRGVRDIAERYFRPGAPLAISKDIRDLHRTADGELQGACGGADGEQRTSKRV
jgi:hypothetical protein